MHSVARELALEDRAVHQDVTTERSAGGKSQLAIQDSDPMKVTGLERPADVKYSSPPLLDKIGLCENPTLVTCLARWVPSSLSSRVFVPRDSRSLFLLFLESRLASGCFDKYGVGWKLCRAA